MTDKERHAIAIRLLEGGRECIAGNYYRYHRFEYEVDLPCAYCDVDGLCRLEVSAVCEECDLTASCKGFLTLEDGK